MKKKIYTLLLLALIAALTACSGQPTLPESSSSADSQAAEDRSESSLGTPSAQDPAFAADPVPPVSPGYVIYENDLFSTEVPEDWEIQKTRLQVFFDTILEPHEGKSIWSSISVNGGGYKDGDIEALYQDYTQTGLEFRYYEMTVAGQAAVVFERGGTGGLGLCMRDIYTEAPNGQRFMLHFNCPNNGEAFSFAAIQEPMDHFLNCLRFKSGESAPAVPAPVAEPSDGESVAATTPALYFDAVEIRDFAGFEGMTRADLKERYGEPNLDDGSVMIYDGVSWNGWIGNMRFFFHSGDESCKTNCASWTTAGDEVIFNELVDTLRAEGFPGESYSPKEGQIEKAFIVNNFELIAGNEDSVDGKWTYLFARLHT